jgi:hypothetical protein
LDFETTVYIVSHIMIGTARHDSRHDEIDAGRFTGGRTISRQEFDVNREPGFSVRDGSNSVKNAKIQDLMRSNVRTLAAIWSIRMTGMANIGNLQIIRDGVGVLAGRFLNAFRAANP